MGRNADVNGSVFPNNLPRQNPAGRLGVILLFVQGSYYLLTGLWPLVSIESFQWVSGAKTDHLVTGRESDHWLVNTVALLIVAVALTLLVAAGRRRLSAEIVVLALSAALGLTTIDVVYTHRQVILPIYLLDAGIEIVFISLWVLVLVAGGLADQALASSLAKRQSWQRATSS